MKNSFETLNAKEQFILREILVNGSLNSLTRYNYNKLNEWNSFFDKDVSTTAYHTWDRIQVVIRKMVAKNILSYEHSFLPAKISPSSKRMRIRTYTIKPYWRRQNSYEVKQFISTFITKAQNNINAYNNRMSKIN